MTERPTGDGGDQVKILGMLMAEIYHFTSPSFTFPTSSFFNDRGWMMSVAIRSSGKLNYKKIAQGSFMRSWFRLIKVFIREYLLYLQISRQVVATWDLPRNVVLRQKFFDIIQMYTIPKNNEI